MPRQQEMYLRRVHDSRELHTVPSPSTNWFARHPIHSKALQALDRLAAHTALLTSRITAHIKCTAQESCTKASPKAYRPHLGDLQQPCHELLHLALPQHRQHLAQLHSTHAAAARCSQLRLQLAAAACVVLGLGCMDVSQLLEQPHLQASHGGVTPCWCEAYGTACRRGSWCTGGHA